MDWAHPKYYKQADPEGFCLDSFLRTLSREFDPTGKTGVPRYDRSLNFVPVPGLDQAICRQRINPSNRSVWCAICDHIDDTIAEIEGRNLPEKWHRKPSFILELTSLFGPLEDFMADYATGYLLDAVECKCQVAESSAHQPKPKCRRSRVKLLPTPPSPDGGTLESIVRDAVVRLCSDEEVGGMPSDLEERFGWGEW